MNTSSGSSSDSLYGSGSTSVVEMGTSGSSRSGTFGNFGNPVHSRWRGLLSKRKEKKRKAVKEEEVDNYMLKREYNLSHLDNRIAEVAEIQTDIFSYFTPDQLWKLTKILDNHSKGLRVATESEVHSLYQQAMATV